MYLGWVLPRQNRDELADTSSAGGAKTKLQLKLNLLRQTGTALLADLTLNELLKEGSLEKVYSGRHCAPTKYNHSTLKLKPACSCRRMAGGNPKKPGPVKTILAEAGPQAASRCDSCSLPQLSRGPGGRVYPSQTRQRTE
jgi:hypothetical protein